MRFSVIILFAASLVSAASVFRRHNDIEVPSCAKECAAKADTSPCKHDDTACLCLNVQYITAVATCVESSCSSEDANKAAEASAAYGKAAGVDPQNPLPDCGFSCLQNAPTNCPSNDGVCWCSGRNFVESAAKCFKNSCSGEDFKTSKCVTEAYCRAVGVDVGSIFGY